MLIDIMATEGELISTLKQNPKLSKGASGYVEIDIFQNSDLHSGYFCYNCIYFIKQGNHCAIVKDSGPDVNGKESGIIAPHGVCTLWDPNEEEAR
jgi:hypothetical protein